MAEFSMAGDVDDERTISSVLSLGYGIGMDAYTTKLDQAMALATDSFRGIYRKGTKIPYLTHLMSVAAMVGEGGGDEEQMIAALLHDYLEDIDGSSREILVDRYGERVARLVVALSDSTTHPKPPWRERKEKYIRHLEDEPDEVKLISAADKLHNCRSIVRDHKAKGDEIFSRFTGKKSGTLWYYRALLPALAKGWGHPLLDELHIMVKQLHALAEVPIGSQRPD
jgi:(p)ppGpp synthase/HD superfamily hydrolase